MNNAKTATAAHVPVPMYAYHAPKETALMKQAAVSKFITDTLTTEEAARLYDRFYYDIDLSFVAKLTIVKEHCTTDEITLATLITNEYKRSAQTGHHS